MVGTINDFSWKIAGAAGDGILNAGLLMFAKSSVRGGLNVFASAEYPSLIRGGHNHLDVRIGGDPIYSHTQNVSLLVALNKESIDKHGHKIIQDGGVIYDGENMEVNDGDLRDDVKKYSIPLLKMAQECGGKIMRNTVAIGATFALTDFDMELVFDIIKENFSRKGDKIVEANIKAVQLGYDYVKENFGNGLKFKLKRQPGEGKIFLSGHEALTMGAIKAGCKFFAAYPMTPASSILHTMAAMENKFNIIVKHTEDEIAAINMAIGASFAGVRSMTATSGGGFALMTEGLGLAAATETPLVAVESQRPGPGSGMATHSGQGDLRYILHASTDEFPRFVIAPGDVDECFHLAFQAFNLTDKYQIPAIIMTDKYLGESYASTQVFDDKNLKIDRGKLISSGELDSYKRYELVQDSISPRAIPGVPGGMHVASSYEHDEHGFEREEESIRIAMHDKRFEKFEAAAKELPAPEIYGDKDAEITIIGWGSTKGPIKEAMKLLDKDGIKTNYLQIVYISPFPTNKVTEIINKAKTTFMVENNKTSQMSGVIRENTGLDIDHKILKYDGRPFSPEEIHMKIKELIK